MRKLLFALSILLVFTACGEKKDKPRKSMEIAESASAATIVSQEDAASAYTDCHTLNLKQPVNAQNTVIDGLRVCKNSAEESKLLVSNVKGLKGSLCLFPYAESNNGATIDFFNSDANSGTCFDLQQDTLVTMKRTLSQYNGVLAVNQAQYNEFNTARTSSGIYYNGFANAPIGPLF